MPARSNPDRAVNAVNGKHCNRRTAWNCLLFFVNPNFRHYPPLDRDRATCESLTMSQTRRTFLATAATAAAVRNAAAKPALLGGTKTRTERWPSWPVFDKSEEDALLGVLRSGSWNRGNGKQV